MEVSIDKIFEYLSWNSSSETQKRGIELASHIKNLSVLIMPIESKLIWENCAKVLVGKSDDELELYFYKLFEWLQDMNWPGAYLIYDRLICISLDKLLPAYQYSLSVAKQTEDCMWEMGLTEFIIEYVLNMIDCHMTPETQSKGISLAKSIEKITPFIRPQTPKHNKNVWDNCAVIISEKSDEKLKPHLVKLLEWLQDMDWPGAFCILDRLQKYTDKNFLYSAINGCIEKAKDCGDQVWESNLNLLLKTQPKFAS